MRIFYSPEFSRRFKRLSEKTQNLAVEKEKIFKENPFDPRLKTHKLNGKYKNFWVFSVDYDCRIIFEFYKENEIRFYAIGKHSIYDN